MERKRQRLALSLIDGDIPVYRAAFSAQHTWYLVVPKGEPDDKYLEKFQYKKEAVAWIGEQEDLELRKTIEIDPINIALSNTRNVIEAILLGANCRNYKLYLTGDGNFREDIAVSHKYKANRPPKPHWYKEVRQYLIDYWNAEVVNGMEADDACSLMQYTNDDTCIVSIDKDLNMVPGWHYDFVKQEHYFISEEEGIRNFYKQLLTGDNTDNIVGLYRVGDKTATKWLADATTEEEMFCIVGKKYAEEFDDPEERLLENGRLLWMMKEPNTLWEFPKKELVCTDQDLNKE